MKQSYYLLNFLTALSGWFNVYFFLVASNRFFHKIWKIIHSQASQKLYDRDICVLKVNEIHAL